MRLLKFASEVRAADDGVITAVLSTESVDRDGDVVQLAGWDLTHFEKAPRLLSCHDYTSLTSQIGEWRNVHVDPARKALVGEAHYYTGQGNVEADWAYFLATQGQATYSVGFVPKQSTPRKGNGGRTYTEQELLEVSHVPVPSQPDALQLMAKAARWTADSTATRRKWDSAFMDTDDGAGNPYGYPSPMEQRCIVAGCDDASQITVPICSEHLRFLMAGPAEPPGSPADDDDIISMGVLRSLRRVAKAGKVISSANMGKLHSAMQSLSDVHSAACTQDDCPLEDGGSSEGPPTGKAAGEGSGSGGGFIAGGVRPDPETGKHGPVKGDTTHTHPVPDGEGGTKNAAHDHADGTSSHGDAGKKAADEPETGKSFDAASFSASLEDAMTKALEAAAW